MLGAWKLGVCSSKRTPHAGSVGVSARHERRGQQSGDDGTEDQGVREAREYRLSGVPEGRHRDSPDRRRTDENALHQEFAQVDYFLGHQGRGDDCQTSSKCGDDEDGRRDGCELVVERIAQRSFQRYWKEQRLRGRVLVLREKRPPSVRVPQETRGWWQKESRRVRRKATAKVPKKGRKGFEGKCFKCGKSEHMSKDCRSKETNAFEVDEEEAGEPFCAKQEKVEHARGPEGGN